MGEFVYGFVSQLVINYIKNSYQHDPFRIALEVLLVFFALKYLLSKDTAVSQDVLTEKEKEQLIAEWTPIPVTELIKYDDDESDVKGDKYMDDKDIEKQRMPLELDLRGTNYVKHPKELSQELKEIVREYGVGTCGPPGFYGTLDLHVLLEHQLADYFDVDTAVLYSQAFSAISSTIPAFIKKDDIVVSDAACHHAIQVGLKISRGSVFTFKHNDMDDLERVLEAIDQMIRDKKLTLPRKYIVVEALYQETGLICDLARIIDLKWKHKCRIILDESTSLGTICGRGGLAHKQQVSARDVDIITGSLSNAVGSCGGFTCGSQYVSDHQRLSSQAYCFSASTPALLAKYAMLTLPRMDEGVTKLQMITEKFLPFIDQFLNNDNKEKFESKNNEEDVVDSEDNDDTKGVIKWRLISDRGSPIVCLQAPTPNMARQLVDILRKDYKIGAKLSDFSKGSSSSSSSKRIVKFNLHTGITEAEITVIGKAIQAAILTITTSSVISTSL